ncbi:hypothetical protein ACIQWR_35985 [Streptomyces sp. NPDC098789]|uniref:hypothetical protein n=1 Tax=Streptomyces sp. NPDC098789 TaxID=3366098 RepID=UPI00382B07A2
MTTHRPAVRERRSTTPAPELRAGAPTTGTGPDGPTPGARSAGVTDTAGTTDMTGTTGSAHDARSARDARSPGDARSAGDADTMAVLSFVSGLVGLLAMNLVLGPVAIALAALALIRGTTRPARARLGLALGVADLVVLACLIGADHTWSWSLG